MEEGDVARSAGTATVVTKDAETQEASGTGAKTGAETDPKQEPLVWAKKTGTEAAVRGSSSSIVIGWCSSSSCLRIERPAAAALTTAARSSGGRASGGRSASTEVGKAAAAAMTRV